MTTGAPRFYVYDLIDPRNMEIFYVGKGCGRRMYSHESRVLKGKSSGNLDKDNRIREILDAGLRVTAIAISFHHSEEDALKAEMLRINKLPGLVNKERTLKRPAHVVAAKKLVNFIEHVFRQKTLAVLALMKSGELQQWQRPAALAVLEAYRDMGLNGRA